MGHSESVANQIADNSRDSSCAPIALFVYNRPWHTRETVEALQKNALASNSDLIIFSDAPKSESHKDATDEVRLYIRQITGFKSITLVEREENLGLAKSIIEGVTSIVNRCGRVIVLEDDLITSPYFLTYMNDALNTYHKSEKVMHISGYMYPVDRSSLPETFFLRPTSCWGWATWDRAWKHFEKAPSKFIAEYTKSEISSFNMDDTYDFWNQVYQNESGAINTWAVFWYASVFRLGGLSLHPAFSMVNNIGHDATGENCSNNSDFSTVVADSPIKYFEKNIVENTLARRQTKKYFQIIHPSFFQRILRRLKIA